MSFYSILRCYQYYCSSYETGQSEGVAKTGEILAQLQAELALSQRRFVWGLKPRQTRELGDLMIKRVVEISALNHSGTEAAVYAMKLDSLDNETDENEAVHPQYMHTIQRFSIFKFRDTIRAM